MRDSDPSSFESGLSGLQMPGFLEKREPDEQLVVARTAGPMYP
jgi:hypothetical protein